MRTASVKHANGVTLIELLLVIIIAGVLSSLAISSYSKYIQNAKSTKAAGDLGKIKLLIDAFRLNNSDALPLTLADVNAGAMKDPWDNNYEYLNFSTIPGMGAGPKRKDHNLVPINTAYDLYSKGPDGDSVSPLTAAKSRDDIILANDGGFIGKASDY
jgi:general secretion pathway protein G